MALAHAADVARQTSLVVPAPPAVDVDHLRLMLGYWVDRPRDPLRIVQRVDGARWVFELSCCDPSRINPPPIRAAGRTREECLRAAAEAAREALRAHLADIDRVVERLTDKRRDIAALLGAPATAPATPSARQEAA